MFKAISNYDGSDTSKCISLCTGDVLSEVHALDETWFIGFNDRTKEAGAFPIACVEPIVSNDYTPAPAKRQDVPREDGSYIYANVAEHIQNNNSNSDDMDPMARQRTQSSLAKSFDTDRLQTSKPDRSFEVQLVKDENNTDAEVSDESKQRDTINKKNVHFEGNQLMHSVSVPESMLSWVDSSYEQSYDDRATDNTGDTNIVGFDVEDKSIDGKYHN